MSLIVLEVKDLVVLEVNQRLDLKPIVLEVKDLVVLEVKDPVVLEVKNGD